MREVFIDRQKSILRIAIKDNNKLKQCLIQEKVKKPLPGEIYKGIVKNIIPAIKCAFIDIGYNKNCYMYLDNKFKNTNIKKGEEVLVQVLKEGFGKKGAKVTNAISIPGRYAVLTFLDRRLSFSKKLQDKDFKRYAAKNIKKPNDVGVIIRTNAVIAGIDNINNEIENIYKVYKEIFKNFKYSLKPKLLFDNGGILGKALRDILNEETYIVHTNNIDDAEYIKKFISDKEEIGLDIDVHTDNRDLFECYGIEKEIVALRNNKVPLKCGGYIVIDKTEAMYTIDVNSGKNVKNNSIKKTVFITNMQAAEEIVKQIKLRNLGGIIVIDFIDMKDEEEKKDVLSKLEQGFIDDKNKTVIYPFTELNLVQIARKNLGKSIDDYIEEKCICCKGRGKLLRLDYIEFLIKNDIFKIKDNAKDIYIILDDYYKIPIQKNIDSFIENINALDKNVYLNFEKLDEVFKVEPLIFKNQIKKLEKYKVYPNI
ncbi:ribonuclease G [Clostridium acetireducens DSM 10703]|uniref:Ribonuclease G n=1 Tax=Clostridium acetireducens DSM 10703 TaxID=1121290 RepID=A0A1E8F176_9CLOT|nr:ribonuclease E/G [Clostridium acetireducens]OFI07217.1 ribonuclease G [Clostridium acetireducens DSM 10703]